MYLARLEKSDSDDNLDAEWLRHSRINSRTSYEEVIYDIINEIPHYFDSDCKSNDDMTFDIKSKRSAKKLRDRDRLASRSVDRRKNIKEGVRKKSTVIFESSNTDSKVGQKDNKLKDSMSSFEIDIETEKAFFKFEEGNGTKKITLLTGYATISDFRFKFYFEDDKNYEKLELTKNHFLIPIFYITKYLYIHFYFTLF